MSASGERELRVESDLRLTVGDLRATIVADGQQLVIATKDAGALLAHAADSVPSIVGSTVSMRELAGRVGRLLDDAGLTAQVTSDRGTLLHMGRGVRSSASRVLLGSEHARLGSVGALLPVAAGYARASASLRRQLSYAAGGVAIAAVFVFGRARRSGALS